MVAVKAAESTTRTPAGVDRFCVGRNGRSTPFGFFGGHIAYVYVWDIALSDGEVASFHGGTLPQQGDLVAGYDFTSDQSTTVIDTIGANDLTVSGASYDGAATPSPTFGGGGLTPPYVSISVA